MEMETILFRHGLRVSEACQLKVTDIDLKEKRIHINRLKKGEETRQPLYNGESGAVNAWLKVRKQMQPHSNFLFISERRQPLSRFMVSRSRCSGNTGKIEMRRRSRRVNPNTSEYFLPSATSLPLDDSASIR
jgi:site-specific recombinase XerC